MVLVVAVRQWLQVHPLAHMVLMGSLVAFYGTFFLPRRLKLAWRAVRWMCSRPVRRWVYERRERRWKARQPKPQRSPYRTGGDL